MATTKKQSNKLTVYLDSTGLLIHNENNCQTAIGFLEYDALAGCWQDNYGNKVTAVRRYNRSGGLALDTHKADQHNELLEAAQLAALDLCNVSQSVAPFIFVDGRVTTYLGAVVADSNRVSCVGPVNSKQKRYLALRGDRTFAFFYAGDKQSYVELKRIA
jgi:hypothetical protein